VRCDWKEATELIAAATVHAIREYGPDRVGGFTPIPAMSPVSFASGARFLALIGGHTTTFYDWYADLPPASPQVFGDQTDVPESADWWDASYLIIWGTNLPITRTPDAHFMTEARYRGQKVVVVSPDYSDHVKFADNWLPAQPGTDAALAMAMGHVILKEHCVERPVARFQDYAKRFTDLPLLVALDERDGVHVPGRFVMAAAMGEQGPLEPAPRRPRPGALAARPPHRRRRGRAAALRRRRHAGRRRHAPRRARDPGRRPAGDDRAGSHARHLRRRP
jgi:nitrate reductase alpha subunit